MNLSRLCLQAPIPVQLNSLMCICKAYAKDTLKDKKKF